ncbi:NAD(P)-binding protein [Polyporus arcularius HHB13444]|uniref:NAD(P)-binding protein n=1 Tax=Polyporus arcularius HHB13444 TaxID=1314778 RepID=A0A5C3NQ71_9APHY|nr:NAD(P)-binding protein [Polyporus arcularius HHB13444]
MPAISEKTAILFTGATGYIGGSVLQKILQHPEANTFEITALVRDAGKAQILETKFGVKAVVGSMEELDKLTELAEKAHIVVQVANADDDSMMIALLAGLRKRHEKTGDVPILIHTSGVGSWADGAGGEYASERVVSDLDTSTFDALPVTAAHRSVDILACKADSEGYVRTYLVLPSAVVGYGEGPLYEAGISKRPSVLVPLLAEIAAKRGRPGVMGSGKNIWAIIHVEDNADLTYRLFSAALTDASKLAHGREGYYLTENGEVTLYELCKAIGTALVAEGVATGAEPTVLTPEERVKYFGAEVYASMFFSNVRCRADRGRRDLGWTPKHPKEEIWKEVADVVKELANKLKGSV